jgi:hypothetical protein
MKSLYRSCLTVNAGLAVALIAGCGGSQSPIGAPGAMPANRSTTFNFFLDQRDNRLYVSSPFAGGLRGDLGSGGKRPNIVVVLDYPTGKRLLTLRQKPGWCPAGVAVSPYLPL